MSNSIRSIIGAILILVITFSAIIACQNIGKSLKIDATAQNLYTLSDGTKAILSKLNQPVTVKLFYAETAALKGPDQIRYFNNYYRFVKSLLEEYSDAANGMIDLQIVDPRPFSDDEAQALGYGLKRFPITEEESFFFGLAVQTQFGIERVIPFFAPDRQNFVEYDISYLIDSSITRQKRKIGILSSLPVMGDDVSGYMAQMMRMQGQQPKPAWAFVEQLRSQFEVKGIEPGVEEITDVDILLVIHPKDLPDQTLFAIDQFVLKNGRTIVCVDPFCFADEPENNAGMQMNQPPPPRNSDLNRLLRTWGVEMPHNTFAGDRVLSLTASLAPNQLPEKVIGFLDLKHGCFSERDVVTSELNQIRLLFSGVLEEIEDNEQAGSIEKTPLIMTTSRGNSWEVGSPYELMMIKPSALMKKFHDGAKAVNMGYLLTGKFKSSFPNGIEVVVPKEGYEKQINHDHMHGGGDGASDGETVTKKLTGLTESADNSAVIVFADVDFISDMVAYQDTFLGKMVVGDNGAMMLNAIEKLGGSSDLISIRSRGNFKRSFKVVDAIEMQAEIETAEEEAKINASIAGFQEELKKVVASNGDGNAAIIGNAIIQKKKELELKIHEQQRELRQVKMKRRQRIESLGSLLQNFNMLMAPAVILIIAIVLSISRNRKKRYYISHPGE